MDTGPFYNFIAALCAYIFLGEPLTLKGMTGGILVLAGILISEFRRNAGSSVRS